MTRDRALPSSARFVELSSPGLALIRALGDAGIGASIGATLTFLGVLVLGIVGEEALSAFYRDLDLDPLFRSSMGGLLVVAFALAATVPWFFAIERFVVLRVAEDHAAEAGEDAVPTRAVRDRLAAIPGAGMVTTGGGLALAFGLLAVISLGMLIFSEDLREDGIALGAFIVFLVLTAGGVGIQQLGDRWARRAEPRVLALREQWRGAADRAEAADAQRRAAASRDALPGIIGRPSARLTARAARVLLAVTGVAAVGFFLSVFLRQQCRNCDPVTWADPIENGIDVLSLTMGSTLMLCAAAGVVALFGGLVLRLIRERALARWASSGSPRSVDLELLRPFLAASRASETAARVLGALGSASLILGLGVAWSGWRDADATYLLLTGAALIPLGVLVSLAGAERGVRERQSIRDVAAPGDPAPVATAQASRRRKRQRR